MIFFPHCLSCQSSFPTTSSINQIALGGRYVAMAMPSRTVKNKTSVFLLKFGKSKDLTAWQSSSRDTAPRAEAIWPLCPGEGRRTAATEVCVCLPQGRPHAKVRLPLAERRSCFHHPPTGGFPVLRLGSFPDVVSAVRQIHGEEGKNKSMQKAG